MNNPWPLVPEEDDIYDAVRKFLGDHPTPPPPGETPAMMAALDLLTTGAAQLVQRIIKTERELSEAQKALQQIVDAPMRDYEENVERIARAALGLSVTEETKQDDDEEFRRAW